MDALQSVDDFLKSISVSDFFAADSFINLEILLEADIFFPVFDVVMDGQLR